MKFVSIALSPISRLSVLDLMAKSQTLRHGVWGGSPALSQSAAVAMGPAIWVNFPPTSDTAILGGPKIGTPFSENGGSELVQNRPEFDPRPPQPHDI